MDSLNALLEGFATALQPQYLLYAFFGVFIGTAVGVLPGIGPAMTVALLLPLTYTLDATGALILFAGIYYGAMYGGSTTSILLNTPGESASIVTALEGHKMAKAGRGAAALATAAIGSFVAGTVATVLLTFLAPTLAQLAVQLGPADYFALIVVAFLTVGALLGSSVSRGIDVPRTRPAAGSRRHRGALRATAVHLRRPRSRGRHRRRPHRRRPLRDRRVALRRLPHAARAGAGHPGDARLAQLSLRQGPPALVEAVASRHRDRVPDRHDPRGRCGRRDIPLVRHRATAVPRDPPRPSSAAGPSRAWPARNRRTTPRRPACSCRCSHSDCRPPRRRRSSSPAFQSYGIRPGPLLFENQPELVWALIASLYIGNVHADRAQSAARRNVGEGAAASHGRTCTRASSTFAGLGAYALRFQHRRHPDPARHRRRWASSCAATAIRWPRWWSAAHPRADGRRAAAEGDGQLSQGERDLYLVLQPVRRSIAYSVARRAHHRDWALAEAPQGEDRGVAEARAHIGDLRDRGAAEGSALTCPRRRSRVDVPGASPVFTGGVVAYRRR